MPTKISLSNGKYIEVNETVGHVHALFEDAKGPTVELTAYSRYAYDRTKVLVNPAQVVAVTEYRSTW